MEFLRELPKVELHAHLNGCIREATLFELARERGIKLNENHFSQKQLADDDQTMYNVRPRSLQDCFEIFAEISKCVDDLPSLSRITMEALEDFAEHHVAYLELRSTPKTLLVKSGERELTDKRAYCKTIINCLQQFEQKDASRYDLELATHSTSLPRLPMVCRFIVAIDRSQAIDHANEHVDLADSLRSQFGDIVVGIDLGGNPTKNNFDNFRGALEKARTCDLKITVHCGEVPCDNDDPETENEYLEAKAILDFAPNRLGHSLLLPPVLQHTLLHKKIPVESCPTSNVMTLELARCHSGSILQGLKTHPQLADWIENFHPFSIGTDDPGVFHTNPTKELLLVQKAFDLDSNRLSQIVVMSMDHAFCIDETRRLVKERIENRIIHLSNLS